GADDHQRADHEAQIAVHTHGLRPGSAKPSGYRPGRQLLGDVVADWQKDTFNQSVRKAVADRQARSIAPTQSEQRTRKNSGGGGGGGGETLQLVRPEAESGTREVEGKPLQRGRREREVGSRAGAVRRRVRAGVPQGAREPRARVFHVRAGRAPEPTCARPSP